MDAGDSAVPMFPAGRWRVDPVHSSVAFQVVDAVGTVATVRGRFRDFEGTLETGHDLANSHAVGVVRVASLTTDNPERDEDLLSPNFFDAAAYPEIRFESREIRPVDRELRIDGTLTMQETPREFSVTARVRRVGRDRSGNERLALEGTSELDWAETTAKITVELSLTHDQ